MTDEAATDGPGALVIKVIRIRGRVKSLTALRKQRDVQEQDIALKAYITAYRLFEVWEVVPIRRGTTGFDPNKDPELIRAAELAKEGRRVVIDDFRRLIDFSSVERARQQITQLIQNIPTLFSIEHDAQLQEFTAKRLFQILRSEVDKQELRSKAGQKAVHTAGPDVRKAVSARANAVRSRKADRAAENLVKRIEEIRSHLPAKDQNNKAAIARVLQEENIQTPSGRGRWQSTTVARVYRRADRTFTAQSDEAEQAPPSSGDDTVPE